MVLFNPIFNKIDERKQENASLGNERVKGISPSFVSLNLAFILTVSYFLGFLLLFINGKMLIYISGALSLSFLLSTTIFSKYIGIIEKRNMLVLFVTVSSGLLLSMISIFLYSISKYGFETNRYVVYDAPLSLILFSSIIIEVLISETMFNFKLFPIRHFYFRYAFLTFVSMIVLSLLNLILFKKAGYSFMKSEVIIAFMSFFIMYFLNLYHEAMNRIEGMILETDMIYASLVPISITIYLIPEIFTQVFRRKP